MIHSADWDLTIPHYNDTIVTIIVVILSLLSLLVYEYHHK